VFPVAAPVPVQRAQRVPRLGCSGAAPLGVRSARRGHSFRGDYSPSDCSQRAAPAIPCSAEQPGLLRRAGSSLAVGSVEYFDVEGGLVMTETALRRHNHALALFTLACACGGGSGGGSDGSVPTTAIGNADPTGVDEPGSLGGQELPFSGILTLDEHDWIDLGTGSNELGVIRVDLPSRSVRRFLSGRDGSQQPNNGNTSALVERRARRAHLLDALNGRPGLGSSYARQLGSARSALGRRGRLTLVALDAAEAAEIGARDVLPDGARPRAVRVQGVVELRGQLAQAGQA